MKKQQRSENRYYRRNKKNLFLNGIKNGNLVYQTWDYEFEEYNGLQIKDVPKKVLENRFKIEDPEYYKHQMNFPVIVDNIKNYDILYGDWWRIGDIEKDYMKYVTISTPYLRNVNIDETLNFEIKSLINEHYHKMFGYDNKYYIEKSFQKTKEGNYELLPSERLKNIKDSYDLIDDWIKENKHSKEYNYYKNLIIETNHKIGRLKEPIIYENKNSIDNKYSLNVIIPFFYKKTYIELFNELLEGKIKKISLENNIYGEEYIETYLKINDTTKRFLSQFIPNIPKNCYLKTNKLKYKSKKKFKNKGKNK